MLFRSLKIPVRLRTANSYLSILGDHGRTDYGFDAEYGVEVRDDDVGVGKIYYYRYRHV